MRVVIQNWVKASGVAGLILAGGAGKRMGRDKPFAPFGRRPLIAHVIDRFSPQVAPLAISAHGDGTRFAEFGLVVVSDDQATHRGPLAGILAGLDFADRSGCDALAVVPCDAPFLPLDLVTRLDSARRPGEAAVAEGEAGPEPLFSLWPVAARAQIKSALEAGRSGALQTLDILKPRRVRFSILDPNPFLNLNNAAELEAAAKWL